VRVTGESSAVHLLPKAVELGGLQLSFEIGTSIHSRAGMTLEEDLVPSSGSIDSTEEVLLAHLVEGGGGGKGRHVAAQSIVLGVGPDHHRHGVPAHDALDAMVHLLIAGVGLFCFDRYRVLVGSDRV